MTLFNKNELNNMIDDINIIKIDKAETFNSFLA